MQTAFEMGSPGDIEALDPLTVLVVDDEQTVLDGLGELLESEGYKVATATDGQDALDQLRTGLRPCAILLDLMMPGMDGWDFRHEQALDPDLSDIPVVIITAVGFSETSVKAQFGDIEFVPKPVPVDALLAAVRRRSMEC